MPVVWRQESLTFNIENLDRFLMADPALSEFKGSKFFNIRGTKSEAFHDLCHKWIYRVK